MKKQQKHFIAFLCLFVFLFSGCSNLERSPSDPSDLVGEQSLTFYVLKDNFSDISSIVTQFRTENPQIVLSITQFDTTEELDDALVRDLNTNTAPDVVLLDYRTTLDLQKMAKSGAFLEFEESLAETVGFDPGSFLGAAVEGCRMDGAQYFIPIAFLPQIEFYSTHAQAQHLFRAGETSRDEYYEILADHAAQYEKDPSVISIFEQFPLQGKTDVSVTQAVLASSGILGDFSVAEEDTLQKTIDWIKLIKEQNEKFQGYDGDFWDHYDTFYWDDNLFYTVSGYDLVTGIYSYLSTLEGIYKDGGDYVIFPKQSDPQAYSVLATFFGAVSKDCDCPQEAFSFLTLVADSYYNLRVTPDNPMWFAPVKTANFEKALEVLMEFGGRVGGSQVDPLSEQEAQRMRDIYEAVTDYALPNAPLAEFIELEFADYFQGTGDYETCYLNFSRKYELYLNE